MWQAERENTLQHTATHCNTLQHTATHKGCGRQREREYCESGHVIFKGCVVERERVEKNERQTESKPEKVRVMSEGDE